MKYLKILSKQTDKNGSYAIFKDNKVSLLDKNPITNKAQQTGISFPINEIEKFLPPVDPPNIIALGLNYKEHAKESNMAIPNEPIIFLKSTSSITGHLQPIILPEQAPDEVDYEGELCIVIGKTAKNVSEKNAWKYVFGYTCGNDVTARDCQMKIDKQWARAKSFDTFCPIGPWIETEINPLDFKIQTRLNGKIMQNDSTKNMIFNIYQIINYLSKQMTLLPGTIIMTGTPPGIGFGKKPSIFLKENDIIEVEIENIGILKNKITGNKKNNI
ncbi:MAG: fumarylacetoacetate hydrolase family protein [Candidatus Omnitrophica bacterium]|jgi:2-keto-4-pentenoate hydratase/2-oxohepta-3-ene-1,7-dioic acid hydratase in catechol pathway|nr:fumarylacetoacetate hydrolase family protein [Candidatus Omnitrophota bacterium]